MQIKTTMRYHLPPIRISATKTKTENNKCWGGCGEIGTSVHRWWDCEMGQPLWKTVWHLHKKFKNSISRWPSNPTSGYLVKVTKSGVWERYLHTCVYNSIVHNSQEVELTQVSMDRRMNKHTVIYIFSTINVSAIKRMEILSHATTWMNLEDIMLSGINQVLKDKYCMIPVTWSV